MEFMDLLKMGASMIESNSDSSTTGIETTKIADALSGLLSNGQGGLNLASLVSGLSQNGLGEIVGSWLGNGENKSISIEQVTTLFGDEKIASFASSLGLSDESAKGALSEILPNVVDKATTGEMTMMDMMLRQSGNGNGAMEMLGKMFR